jgi:hypothetical protein
VAIFFNLTESYIYMSPNEVPTESKLPRGFQATLVAWSDKPRSQNLITLLVAADQR